MSARVALFGLLLAVIPVLADARVVRLSDTQRGTVLSADYSPSALANPLTGVPFDTTVTLVPTNRYREWSLRLPRWSSAYRLELFERGSWRTIAAGDLAPLDGIALPAEALAGSPLRLQLTLYDDAPVMVIPTLSLQNARSHRMLIFALFAGFFCAMAFVNVFSFLLLRSSASAWYTGIMLSMVLILAFSAGMWRSALGSPIVEACTHAALIVLYLGCVTAFGIALLDAWRRDRITSWCALALLGANIPLAFAEDLLGAAWPFYALDQVMVDLLLASLVVLGVRAVLRGGSTLATSYLVAFLGPLAGVPLNDLATHNLLGAQRWVEFFFNGGVAWEATFFAYAVELRNWAIRRERDWFNRLAHLDELTGVANCRTFDEALAHSWSAAVRSRRPLALLMIDIDFFKRINDTQGHRAGDECLREIARRCARVMQRQGDCFARYGGEEFAALLVNADLSGAQTLAERMRRAVEEGGTATISIGVASFVPDIGIESGMLVVAADAALYRAKEAGRNRVVTA